MFLHHSGTGETSISFLYVRKTRPLYKDIIIHISAFVLLVSTAFLLTACVTDGKQKQTAGTILGGIGGAVLGSQIGGGSGRIIATVVGTLGGALIGSEIGRSLDENDKIEMKKAETKAHVALVGHTVTWNNPDSGNSGTVTPVREGKSTKTGATCREYQTTVNVDGKAQEAFGMACQQLDGSWKVNKP
jgi:surface antigen